ncbi:hypothetical protein Fuma_05853 [Fuerstiella marisgermanici]|uniref:Uncharacterized protein n=1 Tax=Fuerstiella marisgermanici TaxID=1891926 RepID=A0A1P8WQ68_9PLAN|nr:hypothetical protein Fuma_05853 [Fuerstiella marisgermanici]
MTSLKPGALIYREPSLPLQRARNFSSFAVYHSTAVERHPEVLIRPHRLQSREPADRTLTGNNRFVTGQWSAEYSTEVRLWLSATIRLEVGHGWWLHAMTAVYGPDIDRDLISWFKCHHPVSNTQQESGFNDSSWAQTTAIRRTEISSN